MLKIYHPLVIISVAFIIGAISFLPLAVIEFIRQPEWVNQITIFGLVGVGYTTLMSSISAYFLYEWAIKRIGIIRADVMQYLQPIIAASLAVPILNERISISFIIGTCLKVAGVYWGTMGKSEHNHHSLRHHRV
jgi:drug/metabolite transporter (DMT)-like permease